MPGRCWRCCVHTVQYCSGSGVQGVLGAGVLGCWGAELMLGSVECWGMVRWMCWDMLGYTISTSLRRFATAQGRAGPGPSPSAYGKLPSWAVPW